MNYNTVIDNLVSTFQHPCDAEIKSGQYRRVKWEKYNPAGEYKNPSNQEEWETEIISRDKRVFGSNPFGQKSDSFHQDLDDPMSSTGIWVSKIGVYFSSQNEIENYVKSIGSELLPNNDWYGADISKSDLFKTSVEKDMYLIENAGGIWKKTGPYIDPRTMLNVDSNYNLTINYNGTTDNRIAYMKHYDDRPCAFTGIVLNLDIDMGIPGTPIAEPPTIAELPDEILESQSVGAMRASVGCLPFTAKFPYSGLMNAILAAWNESRSSFKLYWNMLPGMPSSAEGIFATAYKHLSVAMEEVSNGALAMCQYVLLNAWLSFQQIISTALNIVGGGWSILKNFIPKISFMGIAIDIEEFCTSKNPIEWMRDAIYASEIETEKAIVMIYEIIGSSYDYMVERIKMPARDLIDAITDFYDWCWSQLLMAGVALCRFLIDIALIWSMPPIIPNPVWSRILAIKVMMTQIKPLEMILSGNFPGFTASDIYQLVMFEVNKIIDAAYAEIQLIKGQILDTIDQIKEKTNQYRDQVVVFKQYLSGMHEKITDEITAEKQKALDKSKEILDTLNNTYDQLKNSDKMQRDIMENVLKLAIEQLKKLPIVAQMENLLNMLGTSLDEMLVTYENSVTKLNSLYHQYTSGSRSIKDLIKSIYNQICTLALSKVTQWINKLLAILGLSINFPTISICVPYLKAPTEV